MQWQHIYAHNRHACTGAWSMACQLGLTCCYSQGLCMFSTVLFCFRLLLVGTKGTGGSTSPGAKGSAAQPFGFLRHPYFLTLLATACRQTGALQLCSGLALFSSVQDCYSVLKSVFCARSGSACWSPLLLIPSSWACSWRTASSCSALDCLLLPVLHFDWFDQCVLHTSLHWHSTHTCRQCQLAPLRSSTCCMDTRT